MIDKTMVKCLMFDLDVRLDRMPEPCLLRQCSAQASKARSRSQVYGLIMVSTTRSAHVAQASKHLILERTNVFGHLRYI